MDSDNPSTLAESIRALADFIEAHPDLGTYYPSMFNVWGWNEADQKAWLARAAVAFGACTKETAGESFFLRKDFGHGVFLDANTFREQVCERVVTTETVTEKVRDEAAVEAALAAIPEVEVTREVERVEWRCPPSILAAAEQVSS